VLEREIETGAAKANSAALEVRAIALAMVIGKKEGRTERVCMSMP
jgi:hypothetical protein